MNEFSKDKLYYLASPYSHPSDVVRRMRKLLVDSVGSRFVKQGYHIFGPITESACYTYVDSELDGAWPFWQAHDLLMIDKCDAMIVLMLKGWTMSTGVAAEMKYAREQNKEVHFLDVNEWLPELEDVI